MGEIRFVGTGETRGYPYLVCKKTRVSCIFFFRLSVVKYSFKTGRNVGAYYISSVIRQKVFFPSKTIPKIYINLIRRI